MELDQELLSQLKGLDDAALQAGITRIARSLGFDPNLAQRVLGNPEEVRRAMESLNAADLERITGALGKDRAEQLAQEIRREVQG